jgi:7-carboxy-7-deazaguanine synthase
VKFVIANRQDYKFARDFVREHKLETLAGNVLFSPAFRKDAGPERDARNCLLDPKQLVDWILEDGLNVRLGLQIHKFIWEPMTKGV